MTVKRNLIRKKATKSDIKQIYLNIGEFNFRLSWKCKTFRCWFNETEFAL